MFVLSSISTLIECKLFQLRPLYELVKEVQCASLKKLHLKRATEEYMAMEHPCHCRPCQNNGQPLLMGSECHCVCRPGTSGRACEIGAVIGEQPGTAPADPQGTRNEIRNLTEMPNYCNVDVNSTCFNAPSSILQA